jgi:hypothetical protein
MINGVSSFLSFISCMASNTKSTKVSRGTDTFWPMLTGNVDTDLSLQYST